MEGFESLSIALLDQIESGVCVSDSDDEDHDEHEERKNRPNNMSGIKYCFDLTALSGSAYESRAFNPTLVHRRRFFHSH